MVEDFPFLKVPKNPNHSSPSHLTPNRSRSKNPLRRHKRHSRAISTKRTLLTIYLQIPTLRHNILHFPTISLQNSIFPLPPNRHRNRQRRNINSTRSILPLRQHRDRILDKRDRRKFKRCLIYSENWGTFFEIKWEGGRRFGFG
jgi:hypothetical protein